jgi:hypothetical protein
MELGGEKSREMHSEFWELKGWTEINHETMWVLEWGLFDSMKLTHKKKFSPYQNQEGWRVVL